MRANSLEGIAQQGTLPLKIILNHLIKEAGEGSLNDLLLFFAIAKRQLIATTFNVNLVT